MRGILDGANPAEMPMESPTTFRLEMNLKTAREIGLVLPRSMFRRATRAVE